jgi:hypothetical protein
MDFNEFFDKEKSKSEKAIPLYKATQVNSDEAYAKAKAETEVKEMSAIIQSPQKALNAKLSDKIGQEIEHSEEVDRKVAETTQILVDKGLEEQRNKAIAGVTNSENEKIEADFAKHKDEYLYHGIDHKIDKVWKQKLLLIINDFWFVIWAIVSCFTIVPVSTFLSRIKALRGFIKGVAIVIGILLGLACLGAITYACLKWTGVIKKIKM